jgi:transcriptional regulator with XRE-family HTH domain
MDRQHYNRLKIVLAEKEKTGTWLSEQMGRNIGTVSRWMTNKVQPSVEQLFDIAKHLDVDVREYMDQSSLIRQFGNKIWYFHFNIVYLHSKMNQ